MPRKIISEQLKQEIIEYYKSKPMTLNEVGIKFNLSNPTVGKILKDIPKYPKARIFNPEMNERFFQEINNEKNAYFLGLLISDGNVFNDSTGRQASISITLDLKDEYLLQAFKEAVNSNTSIGYDGRGCGQIAVRSNLMAQDLAQYGVVPRKSYNTYLPQINKSMMSHLIRGILDGDGSILAKQNGTRFLHSISFCGTHQLMSDISDYCYNNLSLQQKPNVYDYKNKQLSEMKIQNYDDIKKFGNWIYSNATIYMKRKKEKYDEIIKHGNTELTN